MDAPEAWSPDRSAHGPQRRIGAGGLVMAILMVLAWAIKGAVAGSGPQLIEPGPDARGFRFLRVEASSGMPLRYNPCEQVHYTINPDLAPTTAIDDVHAAFETTGLVSGIDFVFDGTTDEVPTSERSPYQPDRYGERWAPILIAFTEGTPGLDGHAEETGRRTLGEGGSAYAINAAGTPVYVSGTAVFDGTARLTPGFGTHTWGLVILHELGHVVGLGHVVEPGSVMNDTVDLSHPAWGPGDRVGLWELGTGGGCIETPPLP